MDHGEGLVQGAGQFGLYVQTLRFVQERTNIERTYLSEASTDRASSKLSTQSAHEIE
jgi:hypothetical protein